MDFQTVFSHTTVFKLIGEDNAKDAHVIEVADETQNTFNVETETALQVTPSKSMRSRKKNSVSSGMVLKSVIACKIVIFINL